MQELIGKSIGRYQITASLGEGGMASVYQAHDSKLDRDVAIKLIGIEAATDAKIIMQFEKESRALAKLNHPNIIPILDFGKAPEWLYMVMPLIEGGTLKERLGAPLPCTEAASLLAPIAKALAYAHEKGIIHRDVKPSNILISGSQTPMLSDFGIAKLLEESETVEMTGTMQAAGTPEYMAPECGLGQPTTFASDIYSLGVVLFELITGQKPYTGDSALAIIHKQAYEDLPKPSGFTSQIPGFMNNVLYKALAKDPAKRYASMADFAVVLEKIANGQKINIKAARPLGQQKRKSNPLKTTLISLLVLVLLAFAFVFFGNRLGVNLPAVFAPFQLKPSLTPTSAFTSTPQPTATLQPTATFTPTATVAYPLDIGTPYPPSGQTIGADNINRLTLLAQGGYGNPIKVSYSVDGANLYVCTSLGFAVFETETYSRVAFVENSVTLTDCTFSKSTYEMAGLGTDDRLYIWDLLNQTLVTTFNSNEYGMDKNYYSYFEYSPDGRYLMIGDLLWDMELKTFKNRIWLGGNREFTPDSQQFLVSKDIYVEFRSLENVVLSKKLFVDNDGFLYSQDGSVLMTYQSDKDGVIDFVNFYNSSNFSLISSISFPITDTNFTSESKNHNPYIMYAKAITQDNQYAAIGIFDGQILVININSGTVHKSFGQDYVNSIDFSPSSEELAFTSLNDQGVKVVNLKDSKTLVLNNFYHATNRNYSYWYWSDTRNETMDTVIVNGVPRKPQDQSDYFNFNLSLFFPGENDSPFFLAPRDAEIYNSLWAEVIRNSKLGEKMQYTASPDGNFLATTDGFSVEFFQKVPSENNPGQFEAKRLMYYQHDTGTLAFSEDSQYFADVYQNKATVWRLADMQPVIEINQSKGEFRFFPESDYIAWITETELAIYKTSDGSLATTIPREGFVFTINAPWDLCAVNKVSTIEFYELPSGRLLRTLNMDPLSAESFEFSDNGKLLSIISTRGMLYNWGIPN